MEKTLSLYYGVGNEYSGFKRLFLSSIPVKNSPSEFPLHGGDIFRGIPRDASPPFTTKEECPTIGRKFALGDEFPAGTLTRSGPCQRVY
jgi:hypothetical protein